MYINIYIYSIHGSYGNCQFFFRNFVPCTDFGTGGRKDPVQVLGKIHWSVQIRCFTRLEAGPDKSNARNTGLFLFLLHTAYTCGISWGTILLRVHPLDICMDLERFVYGYHVVPPRTSRNHEGDSSGPNRASCQTG